MKCLRAKGYGALVGILAGCAVAAGCGGGDSPTGVSTKTSTTLSGRDIDLSIAGVDSGEPQAVISSGAIDFGLTNCGSSATSNAVTIENPGAEELFVRASTSGEGFSVEPPWLRIDSGGSGALTVSATVASWARAGEALTGDLWVTTNDPAHTRTKIPLSVTAQGATLAFAPGSPKVLNFGTFPINAPPGILGALASLDLTNTGNAPAAFAFSDPTDTHFSFLALPHGAAIQPGGDSGRLVGQFLPTELGGAFATSTIRAVDGAICGNSVPAILFVGVGVPAGLFGWPEKPDLTGPGIDFGDVACGSAPATSTFTLTNRGSRDVRISSVELSGTAGYSTDLAAGTIVPVNGSLSVTVTAPAVPFPGVPGTTYPGTLTVWTDEPGDWRHVLDLKESAFGAILALDTSATSGFGSFGTVDIGTTASQAFRVLNSGSADATIRLSASAPFSVNPHAATGASVDATVSFAPTSPGPTTGSLGVTADALCQAPPAAIALSGTGNVKVVDPLSVSVTSLPFQAACGCASSSPPAPIPSFTITNVSSAPVTWTSTVSGGSGLDVNGSTLSPGEAVTVSASAVSVPGMITIQSTAVGGTVFTDKVFLFTYTDNCMLSGGLPTGIDFGNVKIGSNPQFTLYTGGIPLSCCSGASFAVTAPTSNPAGYGAPLVQTTKEYPGTTWLITFNPLILGPQSATLTITRMGSCEHRSILVTGTAVP